MSRNRIIPFNHPSWDYSLWESIKSQREKMQQEEITKAADLAAYNEELVASMNDRITSLEDQLLDVDEIRDVDDLLDLTEVLTNS